MVSMPSEVDVAKRDLVRALRDLAAKYGVKVALTRESANKDVEADVASGFRKVRKEVADKGGAAARS